MSTAKFQATHGIIANAPAVISLLSDSPILAPRLFLTNGTPSSTTLGAGNGRYCATQGGYVVAAAIANGGSGFTASQILADPTTGSTLQITVDAVDANGSITDCHVSTCGDYSASNYPSNPLAIGLASFNLAIQPADFCYDYLGSQLYICTTAGTKTTSVWTCVTSSGGWNYRGAYVAGTYNTNDVVQLGTGTSAGMYLSLINGNTNAPDSGIGWVQISTSSGTWL